MGFKQKTHWGDVVILWPPSLPESSRAQTRHGQHLGNQKSHMEAFMANTTIVKPWLSVLYVSQFLHLSLFCTLSKVQYTCSANLQPCLGSLVGIPPLHWKVIEAFTVLADLEVGFILVLLYSLFMFLLASVHIIRLWMTEGMKEVTWPKFTT